jgi:hypothetical protein
MMPYFGRLFDLHDYSRAFWIAAAFPIAGAGVWLVLSQKNMLPADRLRATG